MRAFVVLLLAGYAVLCQSGKNDFSSIILRSPDLLNGPVDRMAV